MKFLKITGIVMLSLIAAIALTLLAILQIDNNNSSYLSIADNEPFQTNSYLISNVNVVPMTSDTVLANQTVLVKDGRIAAIGSSLDSSGLEVFDGQGRYLSPGLMDMHVHVWDKQELGLYLANGVTTVRGMWGIPFHLRLKQQIEGGELLAPSFYPGTPKLTGPTDMGVDKVQVQSPEEAKKLIAGYKADGYDFVKTYAGMPKDIFDAIVEQARLEQMTIAAHPSSQVDYAYHFKDVFESVEHTEEIVQTALRFDVDSVKLKEVIDLYVRNDMAHTPTLSIFQNIIDIIEQGEDLLSSEEVGYMNPAFVALGSMEDYNRWTSEQSYNPETLTRISNQHELHIEVVRMLHEAGVTLLCGTDAGIMFAVPGFSLHEELFYFLQAGLSPYEALKTATVNPGTISPRYADAGTIEPGKWADFVLTKENPLDRLGTLRQPVAVWVRGRLIEEESLLHFRDKAKNRKNFVIDFAIQSLIVFLLKFYLKYLFRFSLLALSKVLVEVSLI